MKSVPSANRKSKPFVPGRLGDESGSALVITLLVIATLVGLTLAFSQETGVELDLAGYAADRYRVYLGVQSAVQAALFAVSSDEDRKVDSLKEKWAAFSPGEDFSDRAGEMSISGSLADESGKFNVNTLLNADGGIDPAREQQLLCLFQVLGLEEEQADSLLDWLDADDVERMNGAENAYYRQLSPPYSCGNGPFVTMAQIRRVKGMQEADVDKYLTVYSTGKVNLNTASEEVIGCLSEQMDDRIVGEILSSRREKDFAAVDELKELSEMNDSIFNGIEPFVDVKSSTFSITFDGLYRGTRSKITAVAERSEEQTRLIYWRTE